MCLYTWIYEVGLFKLHQGICEYILENKNIYERKIKKTQ